MLTPDQLARFESDGFFILDSFFKPDEILEITSAIDVHADKREEALRAVGAQGISRAGEISFASRLAEQDSEIATFCCQPKLANLMAELIGPDVRLYWNQSVYKQPETPREFPWHQDNGYTPVRPQQYYTCWLALTDSTVENGCIWVLPGSHKQGEVPHEESALGRVGYRGDDPGIPVPLQSGSMAVFSSLLMHRSGPNLSKETRKAFIMQYIPANACNGITGEPFIDRMWVIRGGGAV